MLIKKSDLPAHIQNMLSKPVRVSRLESSLELDFFFMWRLANKDIHLVREFKFLENRKYRFDFAHPQTKTAIEINGGTHRIGGHSSKDGLNRDYEKLNLAQMAGWKVFQLSEDMINVEWITKIREFIDGMV